MGIVNVRQTGFVAFNVVTSNPNGNADDGMPRVFDDGRGWMSNVSIKRKIRDMLVDHESPVTKEIFSKTGIKPAHGCILESHSRGFPEYANDLLKAKHEALSLFSKDPDKACDKYIDVRLFGTTLLEDKEAREERQGKDNKSRPIFTGCVQIEHFVSLKPVEIVVATATKKAPFEDKHLVDNNCVGTFAHDAIKYVRHGIYCGMYHVSPHFAHRTRTQDVDIEALKFMIGRLFACNVSNSAPCICPIIAVHAKHSSVLGSFALSTFRNVCTPTPKGGAEDASCSLDDYDVPTFDSIKKDMSGVDVVNLLPY